jgi:hypothetical protein
MRTPVNLEYILALMTLRCTVVYTPYRDTAAQAKHKGRWERELKKEKRRKE